MAFVEIEAADILVNKDNDRHGPQGSELSAIEWLVKNKTAHMRNLIKDIAESGRVFEPPLLAKLDGSSKFTAFDGNRRVAALKILLNPSLVFDHPFRTFVEGVVEEHGQPNSKIMSQVEEDIDLVEEIVFRRHSGSQAGVGQSPWDPAAKQNFRVRTGKHTRLNLASVVEGVLQELGLIEPYEHLKRSVLNRLLSAEVYRARVGLKTKDKKLFYTHTPESVLKAFNKILADMESGQLTLNTVWAETEKTTYLNTLDKAGFLPGTEDLLGAPYEFNSENMGTDYQGNSQNEPSDDGLQKDDDELSNGSDADLSFNDQIDDDEPERSSLIPQDKAHQLDWPDDAQRIRQIWRELQFKLDLADHICAISVLERVLIELIIDRYAEKNPEVPIKDSDGFGQKIKKTAIYLSSSGEINSDYKESLIKMMNGEEIVSINTLNKYVHSAKLNPSPQHVCAIWDTLSELIIKCLKQT